MIIDYVNRLKELQEDRSKFERQKDRSNYREKMNKHESKYQTYIIEQMNDKNRLVAAAKIQGILNRQVNRVTSTALQAVIQTNAKEITSSISIRSSVAEFAERDDNVTVNFLLVKLCTDSMRRIVNKGINQTIKGAFAEMHKFSKKKRILDKTCKLVKSAYIRDSFRRILTHDSRQCHNTDGQNKLFDQSFSVIFKNDKQNKRPVGMSQSYLSFILEKDCPQTDFTSQRQSALIISRQREEICSLHGDLSYLRTILAEKTLQLKKKTLECDKLLEQAQLHNQSLHQSSGYESRNSSYYSELQKQLTGGKRIRKNNGTQLNQSSTSIRAEEISRQLLSKYMKESFKQKETMDLARDLCIELCPKLKPQLKRQMQQVIKTLSFGEQASVVDSI